MAHEMRSEIMIIVLRDKLVRSLNDFEGRGTFTFLNPYSYLILRGEKDLLKKFSGLYCDGIILCIALLLVGIKAKRVSFDMTSLAPRVLEHARRLGKGIYFIGGKPGQAEAAVKIFCEEFPGLNVKGVRDGYFENHKEREHCIESLVQLNPEFIVIGMGAPLQERFLIDLWDAGWSGKGYTCGGFFHQTAKSGLKYYPKWMDRFNLRWLYRMIDEPKLMRRYCIDYPKFAFFFIYDVFLFYKKSKATRK